MVMNPEVKKLIDKAKVIVTGIGDIDRDTIISLLDIEPGSEECEYLGKTAREVARINSNNQAKVGTSIGLDLCPCSASCEFCALGSKWGLVKENCEISDEHVIEMIRTRFEKGNIQFTLRTTEYYSLERLAGLARRIRKEIPGKYFLTANTGELTIEDVRMLKEAGFTGAYHVPRLGEGRYTPFSTEERLATIRNIKEGGLMLATGLDPIGIEFSNEELADQIILLRSLKPAGICTMRRESVKGTPLGDMEEISETRLAQIAAVIRMSFKGSVAVHPAIQLGFDWGANNAAAEIGATPREEESDMNEWLYRHDVIEDMLRKAGYDFGSFDDFS